jgi:hypothetical protein
MTFTAGMRCGSPAPPPPPLGGSLLPSNGVGYVWTRWGEMEGGMRLSSAPPSLLRGRQGGRGDVVLVKDQGETHRQGGRVYGVRGRGLMIRSDCCCW